MKLRMEKFGAGEDEGTPWKWRPPLRVMASPGMHSPAGFRSPMRTVAVEKTYSSFPAVLPYHTPASVASRRALVSRDERADWEGGRSSAATVGGPEATATGHRPARRPPAVAMAPRVLQLAATTAAELRRIDAMCAVSTERLSTETPAIRRARLANVGPSALINAEETRATLEATAARRVHEAATRIQTAFRGHKTRRWYREERGKLESARDVEAELAAATTLAPQLAKLATQAKRRRWKLEKAARDERFDVRMGPGMSPAARRIDRERLAEALRVFEQSNKCVLCEQTAPHSAAECGANDGAGLPPGADDVFRSFAAARADGGADGGAEGDAEGALITSAGGAGGALVRVDDVPGYAAICEIVRRAGAWSLCDDDAFAREAENLRAEATGGDSHLRSRPPPLEAKLALAYGTAGVEDAWTHADAGLADPVNDRDAKANATSLRLEAKGLDSFPRLGLTPRLRELVVARNQIEQLPETLDEWTPSLRSLDARRNKLGGALAESVGRMRMLTSLRLDSNDLSSLPEGLGNLTSLVSLSASRNALVRLPDSIGDCKSLRHLDVCRNKLMRLPESLFAGCAELEELWARDNQLVFMPGRPGIPKTIRLAKRLRKLDVGGNRLTSNSFPPLDALVALEGLWLSDNNLTHLPKGLAGCANLRVLKVDGNRLESIGFDEDGIPAMRSLEILSAKDNALQRVGRALGRSPTLRETLKELDLTGNRLPGFPASIGRLQSLFAFRVIAGNSALNPYKRRLLAGPNGAGEHTIGSNASVDSKASARAARALANALDYLEKVDDELRECNDWHPGLRDRERAERSNRKGRLRRRSVWGLWEGTGARGGFDAPLDGGPGLNGLGKEGEHEVQQRKLHLVMAFTKKSRRKRGDEGEDGDGDEKSAPGDGDGEKDPDDGARERHAKSQKITRQIRRGSELDGVMKRALRNAPVLDVMSDDDLNLLANRGFTMHRFAPGAPVTAAGDEREETRVMYVVVEGSVEETRAWNDVISQAVPETLADRVAKAGRTIIFGASAPADPAVHNVVWTYTTGDAIGEMQLLTGAPHPASTRAGPRGATVVELSKRDTELAFVNDPSLERTVARSVAARAICDASRLNPVGWAGWTTEEFAAAATHVAVDATDPEGLLRAAVAIVGERRVREAERRLFKSAERHFYREELDAYAAQTANAPKKVAPAKELWARLRKTFFVERWRRAIHGLDLLRCFTADELRVALRHPRTRERTLDVGKSVTIEGETRDLRIVVVLSGSLKVYLRSAEVSTSGRVRRASNPLIDASRLSYAGGVTVRGSRSGKRLAIAPKEATHVRVGSVPERGTFGSMQALTGRRWDKTAVCAERDTRVLSIPAEALAVVIKGRPAIADELAKTIAWRRKVEAATADASAAAMEAAARGAARDEVLAAARGVVPKPPSQAEIAELAEEIAKFVGC